MKRLADLPEGPAAKGSAALRGVLALGLGALLLWHPARDDGDPAPVSASTSASELARRRAARPEEALAWVGERPPPPAVAALLAGAARAGADVTLRIPGMPPALTLDAPPFPVAGRRAALVVRARGEPGDTLALVLEDPSGGRDTVRAVVDGAGRVRTAVAIRPTRPGASTWTVRAGVHEASALAWVRPEARLRVLVLGGPPTWESRFLARALEASGAAVAVSESLGRDVTVASLRTRPPRDLADLADVDVVAVVGEGGGDALLALLGRWVEERGGGVLLVGVPAVRDGPLRGWGRTGGAAAIEASGLAWPGPPEIDALPPASLDARAAPVATPPGAVVLVRSSSAPLAAAGWVGRGRVMAWGLETWPWRMEEGRVEAHEALWASAAEWLAGGLTAPWWLTGPAAAAGLAWTGRVRGDAPPRLELIRPEGDPEPPLPVTAPAGVVRFLPTVEGAHVLEQASSGDPPRREGPSLADGLAVGPADRGGSWAGAALAVGGAAGRIEAGPSLEKARERVSPERVRWRVFLLLALLAATSWLVRRRAGLR